MAMISNLILFALVCFIILYVVVRLIYFGGELHFRRIKKQVDKENNIDDLKLENHKLKIRIQELEKEKENGN